MISEEKTDVFANVMTLLDKLPPQFQAWAIIGLFVVGGIWWWRKSSEEKEPSQSRTVHIGGSADKAIIQTGDNNQVLFDFCGSEQYRSICRAPTMFLSYLFLS